MVRESSEELAQGVRGLGFLRDGFPLPSSNVASLFMEYFFIKNALEWWFWLALPSYKSIPVGVCLPEMHEFRQVTISLEMGHVEPGAVIKYLPLKQMTPTQIYGDLVGILRELAASYGAVQRWCRQFKRGRQAGECDVQVECPQP